MSNLPKDFDQVAVAIDWLDACRQRNIEALLDLYSLDASLACECDESTMHRGRAALQAYWQPRLDAFSTGAFGLEEIVPAADGVVLDYLNGDGKPVRIHFTFDAAGKILQTRCGPLIRPLNANDAVVPDQAERSRGS
jgi:SnoaL-like domain